MKTSEMKVEGQTVMGRKTSLRWGGGWKPLI